MNMRSIGASSGQHPQPLRKNSSAEKAKPNGGDGDNLGKENGAKDSSALSPEVINKNIVDPAAIKELQNELKSGKLLLSV
jgi:hypothetical protein